MCSINQTSSWYYSLQTTIQPSYQKPINFLSTNHRNSSKITIFAVHNSKEDSSLPKPSSSNVPEIPKSDRIKLAFERAQKYKKSLVVNDVNQIIESPIPETGAIVNLSGDGDVRKEETVEVVTAATEKDEIYAKNEGLTNSQTGIVESSEDEDDGKEEVPEAVRIAMEKAREYKKNKGNVNDEKSNKEKDQSRGNEGGGETEVPEAVRIAMGKASEYKKNKGVLSSSNGPEKQYMTGLKNGGASNSRDETIEKNTNKKDDLKVSSIDFVGLGFADKKSSRGLPAGLVPFADPFPDGDSQEVEIIVGDASRFGNATSSETEKNSEEESSELYKPKVSTWGVFPRPSNISETYGGGRTIRPGDTLETAEDRAAKEAQTRKLLAAYKRKIGLNMDPKLKADCQKSFRR
ncbi:hypothetical protein RND81_03G139000 [Saponaria officinalis]|uniref:Uncharacterized protein n=1 Tax=Saponaria officinalis TaxID=3572 RepID=A0AAW1M0B7_SAPOF